MPAIHYKRNELSQFRQGTPVEVLKIPAFGETERAVEHVGHVVRFGKNVTDEVVVHVLCEDGKERAFHPFHLQLMNG